MSIRVAFRTLLRSRLHAVATIGTVALTIALSATVFAVVDGVLFRPLPYPDPERLYFVDGVNAKNKSAYLSAIDVRYLAESDARFGICPIGSTFLATNPSQPELSVSAGLVGSNFFEVLGMRPLMGGFMPEHFLGPPPPGAPRPAILTYRAWRRWMPDQPDPVGRTLDLPGTRLAVVGVLPENFVSIFGGISEVAAILPLVAPPAAAADRWSRDTREALVRVPRDVGVADARGRLNHALSVRAGEYPIPKDASATPSVGVRLRAVADVLGTLQRRSFTVAFLGAMLLVLLGAVNVTALTVARAGDRAREFGLRAALGALRPALVRLWLTESALIAVIGGAVGLALAEPAIRATASIFPWHKQLPMPIAVDWRVAVFAFLAAIGPLFLTAIAPALTASRRAMVADLSVGPRSTLPRRSWSRGVLLVAESAIGMTLVLVGSLILAGYLLLRSEDVGFDPERLAIVELARVRGETPETWQAREMLAFDRVRQVPGVREVAIVGVSFLGRMQQIRDTTFAASGSEIPSSGDFGNRVFEFPISGAFFEIAGLRLVAGRYPSRSEIDSGQPIAVLNERAARTYFHDEPALGRTLSDGTNVVTVVGIVEQAEFTSQVRQNFGQIYFPIRFKVRPSRRILLVQTDGAPQRVAADIGGALKRDIPGVLVVRSESMDEALVRGEPALRFDATLFGLAGGAALLLVIVGVAGLVATNVAHRRREMGIRTALGAKPRQLIRLVIATQLRPVVLGVALGLTASWWTSNLVRAYRYDSHDPRVWAAATAIVLCAAIVAAWLPARRASRVNPVIALRSE